MKTDVQLQKDVIDELSWDPKLKESQIGVAAKDGIVTLSGFTSNYEQKLAAEKAAYRVSGVRGVAEEIEIKLPGAMHKTDADIATMAANALKWNVNVPDVRLKVKVEDGWVTLSGDVDWWYQQNEARKAVENLAGVRGVINMIGIKSSVNPTNVKSEIEKAFQRSASLAARNIQVQTKGSTVVLNGNLPTWHDINEAISVAWTAPGVQEVVNNLKIEIPEMITEY